MKICNPEVVIQAICEATGIQLTNADLSRMQLVPKTEHSSACDVISYQFGDLTILACIMLNESKCVVSVRVKTVAW